MFVTLVTGLPKAGNLPKSNALSEIWEHWIEIQNFCPHNVFMCFVWISEQTAIISLQLIGIYNKDVVCLFIHPVAPAPCFEATGKI
jgi:hypothetical protein